MKNLVFFIGIFLSFSCMAGKAIIKAEVIYNDYASNINRKDNCVEDGEGLTEEDAKLAARANCENNYDHVLNFKYLDIKYSGSFPGYGPSDEENKLKNQVSSLKNSIHNLKEQIKILKSENSEFILKLEQENKRHQDQISKLKQQANEREVEFQVKIKDISLRGERYLSELNLCTADLEKSQANNLKVVATGRKAKQLKLVYDEIRDELTNAQLE